MRTYLSLKVALVGGVAVLVVLTLSSVSVNSSSASSIVAHSMVTPQPALPPPPPTGLVSHLVGVECPRIACSAQEPPAWLDTNSTKSSSPSCTDLTFRVLIDVLQVARTLNLDIVLSWGTALGAVREQDIIAWDYDADVTLRNNTFPGAFSRLRHALGQQGLSLVQGDVAAGIEGRVCISDVARYGVAPLVINTDLVRRSLGKRKFKHWKPYIWRKGDDFGAFGDSTSVHVDFLPNGDYDGKLGGDASIFPPISGRLRNVSVPLPKLVHKFLVSWYGDQWRTPVRFH